MSLKGLIANQRLRIDAHSRGAVTPKDLRGVHIHKTFIEGKRKRKWVKIYINGEIIEFDKSLRDNEQVAILNEIEKVLKKDRQRLIEFGEFITDTLWRWTSGEITLEKAQEYSRNIAKRFNLNSEIKEEFVKRIQNRLVQYISLHKDEQNKDYLIDQNIRHISIAPGKVYLKRQFKKYR